jgi:hypothetical protein
MPLFAFVSGLVYSFSPAFMVGRRTFLARKFERLAIPLLTMTLVMFILKAIVPGARTEANLADLPSMLWFGYSHLWFLQSMLLVFLLIGVLGKSLADLRSRSVLLLVAIVLALTPLQHVEGFSFGGAIRLLPFFVLGTIVHLGIVSYRVALPKRPWIVAWAIALLVVEALNYQLWSTYNEIVVGGSAVLLVFLLMPHSRPMLTIGRYSMIVFLLHGICISIGERLIAAPPHLLAVLLTFWALLVPIAVQIALERWFPNTLWLFGLGKRRFLSAWLARRYPEQPASPFPSRT